MKRRAILLIATPWILSTIGCTTAGYRDSAIERPALRTPTAEAGTIEGGGNRSGSEPPAPGPSDFTTNTADRVVIYRAEFNLTVEDIRGTLDQLKAMSLSLQGYMQEMSQNSIILRIPAARLNEAARQVEKMGTVTHREIHSEDVTEEMRDLDIRLRNLDEMRSRLYSLLNKGGTVQDLLLIEKELERVTESIELIKGRIQSARSNIAYSTLTVALNSPVPQEELKEVMPFDWVRRLASDVALSRHSSFRPERRQSSKVKFECPSKYVKVDQQRESIRAMSGEGVVVLVERHANFENGSPEFWTPIIRRWLSAAKIIAIGEENELPGSKGARGKLFVGSKVVGLTRHQYMVAVFVSREYVYTYECWGQGELVAKDRDILEKSMATMRVE